MSVASSRSSRSVSTRRALRRIAGASSRSSSSVAWTSSSLRPRSVVTGVRSSWPTTLTKRRRARSRASSAASMSSSRSEVTTGATIGRVLRAGCTPSAAGRWPRTLVIVDADATRRGVVPAGGPAGGAPRAARDARPRCGAGCCGARRCSQGWKPLLRPDHDQGPHRPHRSAARPPAGSASTPSPAACPSAATPSTASRVDGVGGASRGARRHRCARAAPADLAHQGLPVRHRLAGRRRAVAGGEAGRPARRRRRATVGHPRALLVLRRRRTPRPSRWSRPSATTCSSPTGWRASAVSREHGGPVRLYVAPMYGYKSLQVARAHRGRRRARRPHRPRLLGALRLRRRRVGRASRTAAPTTRPHDRGRPQRSSRRRPGRALLARGALAALDERHLVPRAARHGDDALPAVALHGGGPAACS